MTEKEFDFEIITEGSFTDEGFNVSTVVIRLNNTALNEYLDSTILNSRGVYETDKEFELYKRSKEEKRKYWERKILERLKFKSDTGYSITQSVSEIFTVVLFATIAENADQRLSSGQATLNEIRKEIGLDEIDHPAFNRRYVTVKQDISR